MDLRIYLVYLLIDILFPSHSKTLIAMSLQLHYWKLPSRPKGMRFRRPIWSCWTRVSQHERVKKFPWVWRTMPSLRAWMQGMMQDETPRNNSDCWQDMGAAEVFPQYIAHHPNGAPESGRFGMWNQVTISSLSWDWLLLEGRLFAVCGDGEFVIYTAQANSTLHNEPMLYRWNTVKTVTFALLRWFSAQEQKSF